MPKRTIVHIFYITLLLKLISTPALSMEEDDYKFIEGKHYTIKGEFLVTSYGFFQAGLRYHCKPISEDIRWRLRRNDPRLNPNDAKSIKPFTEKEVINLIGELKDGKHYGFGINGIIDNYARVTKLVISTAEMFSPHAPYDDYPIVCDAKETLITLKNNDVEKFELVNRGEGYTIKGDVMVTTLGNYKKGISQFCNSIPERIKKRIFLNHTGYLPLLEEEITSLIGEHKDGKNYGFGIEGWEDHYNRVSKSIESKTEVFGDEVINIQQKGKITKFDDYPIVCGVSELLTSKYTKNDKKNDTKSDETGDDYTIKGDLLVTTLGHYKRGFKQYCGKISKSILVRIRQQSKKGVVPFSESEVVNLIGEFKNEKHYGFGIEGYRENYARITKLILTDIEMFGQDADHSATYQAKRKHTLRKIEKTSEYDDYPIICGALTSLVLMGKINKNRISGCTEGYGEFCDFPGGDLLNAIYRNDSVEVRFLNKGKNLVPDLAIYYMYKYKDNRSNCFKPGYQTIVKKNTTDIIRQETHDGRYAGAVGGHTTVANYTVNKEFVQLCNNICTHSVRALPQAFRMIGPKITAQAITGIDKLIRHRKYSCQSPVLKQFERNLIKMAQ